MKVFGSLLFALTILFPALSQSRKLSSNINQSSVNITAPALSADGKRLVFLSDYSSSGDLTMKMSTNEGGWQEPVTLPETFNKPKLNYAWGNYLNFDGSKLFFSSRRSGSVGYDIWVVEYINGEWVRPRNLSPDINSNLHEASASLTPDENEIYFMRCTAMLNYNASGCKIFYSKKENGKWTEPEELPESINSGNTVNPRILSDGKTLIYASNKIGGKGKFDLYKSVKNRDGSWIEPVALDFINTENDDMMCSVNMFGNLIMVPRPEGKTDQLYEVLMPEEYRPQNILFLDYRLKRDFFGKEASLIVQNWNTGEELKRSPIDSGNHRLVLEIGPKYHVMIQAAHLQRGMVSKIFDAENLDRTTTISPEFYLTNINTRKEIELEGVAFSRTEPFIEEKSYLVLDQLSTMLRLLPDNMELDLVQTNYMEDTLFTHEDLTEIRYDTTYTTRIDTILIEQFESSFESDTLELMVLEDSAIYSTDSVQLMLSLDSVGIIAEVVDSLVEDPGPYYELKEVEEMHITKYYHNDRFQKYSEELRKWLTMSGVSDDKIMINRVMEPMSEKADRFLRLRIN